MTACQFKFTLPPGDDPNASLEQISNRALRPTIPSACAGIIFVDHPRANPFTLCERTLLRPQLGAKPHTVA